MAAFDTGGFAPQAQNIMYYHSFLVEAVCMIVMLWGAMSFSMHYALWTGNKKSIFKDSEMRIFFISIIVLFIIVLIGLGHDRVYETSNVMFRKGFFHLFSERHTHVFSTNQTCDHYMWLAFLSNSYSASLSRHNKPFTLPTNHSSKLNRHRYFITHAKFPR